MNEIIQNHPDHVRALAGDVWYGFRQDDKTWRNGNKNSARTASCCAGAGIWYQEYGIRNMVSGIWCQENGIGRIVLGICLL
ncbi:hypothetical protein DXC92_09600 [Clostridiales bacterium TF09-2AC]|nr:hypothetical protein DXC92_09600 [Clostridiales bacterium TF09-2AC]